MKDEHLSFEERFNVSSFGGCNGSVTAASCLLYV